MTLTELMSMSDSNFFELFETATLIDKKQIQKGLEIEMFRLVGYKTELEQELRKWCETDRDSHLKSLLEIEALFTRMQIRQSYATYIVRKDALELMTRR